MIDAKYRSRKWRATKAALALEFATAIVAVIKFIQTDNPAMVSSITVFILSTFGAIATTLGFYFAANVTKHAKEGNNE